MDNQKILLLITAIALLLIFLVKRRKWKKEVFAGAAPGNIGVQAVYFFERFLGFLPKIGAEGKKGSSLFDGSIIMHGEERGAYVFSEQGGMLTYFGVSVFLSTSQDDEKYNNACEKLLLFVVNSFVGNGDEAKGFFRHSAEGVLAREERENIIETVALRFRCSLERDYSQALADEVPETLKHIKKPVVVILEVMPAAIEA